MSDPFDDDLASNIADLTEWNDELSDVWRRALDAHVQERGRWRLFAWSRAKRGPLLVAASLVVVSAAAIMATLISMDKSDGPIGSSAHAPVDATERLSLERAAPAVDADQARLGVSAESLAQYSSLPSKQVLSVSPRRTLDQSVESYARAVIQKATIELDVADVEAAFVTLPQLLRVGSGEYVESSSLRGKGDAARAELTLRIASSRLTEALNEIRGFGTVRSEQMHGEDVTMQVVDVDSRLRNERRIETELLELLSSRQDADLEDLLLLRRRIGEVRAEIEHMEGRLAHLHRAVALASVVVVLRPDGAAVADHAEGISDYFENAIAGAWAAGVRSLISAVAGILRVAVAGVPWWFVAIVLLALIRKHIRRAGIAPAAV